MELNISISILTTCIPTPTVWQQQEQLCGFSLFRSRAAILSCNLIPTSLGESPVPRRHKISGGSQGTSPCAHPETDPFTSGGVSYPLTCETMRNLSWTPTSWRHGRLFSSTNQWFSGYMLDHLGGATSAKPANTQSLGKSPGPDLNMLITRTRKRTGAPDKKWIHLKTE